MSEPSSTNTFFTFFPLGAGLVGNELHAEDLLRLGRYFVEALSHFHSPALAAASGVDLRLHHSYWSAQLLGYSHGFFHRESDLALRSGDACDAEKSRSPSQIRFPLMV